MNILSGKYIKSLERANQLLIKGTSYKDDLISDYQTQIRAYEKALGDEIDLLERTLEDAYLNDQTGETVLNEFEYKVILDGVRRLKEAYEEHN